MKHRVGWFKLLIMSAARGVVAAPLALCAGIAPAAAEPADDYWRAVDSDLKAAYAKAADGDYAASLRLLEKIAGDPRFAGSPDQGRLGFYELASSWAYRLKDDAASHRYAMIATRIEGADADFWRGRLGYELQNKQFPQAAATVEAMAARNPAALNAMPIQWLYTVTRESAKQPDAPVRRRLLALLAAPAYQPNQVLVSGDPFKRDYAAALVDAGDKAGAAALVARIERPAILVSVSVDPRLRDMLPAGFDARTATERALALAREVAASHPGSMYAVLEMSRYLRQLGRDEEALATIEAARPDEPAAGAFTDLAERRNWWWDEAARSYERLGRYDDAVAAFGKGVDAKEGGGLNVSQTLNLGDMQLRFGRPREALATVAPFAGGKYVASPYGEMVLRFVRGCARAGMGDKAGLEADVAYAMAHERDNSSALTELLLCAGDMDGAAAAMIRRLDDPERRAAALLDLSDYDPPPAGYPPSVAERLYPALKARPDVRAAIARAGGTRRFRIQR